MPETTRLDAHVFSRPRVERALRLIELMPAACPTHRGRLVTTLHSAEGHTGDLANARGLPDDWERT